MGNFNREDMLTAVQKIDGPAFTPREVAFVMGVPRRTAYYRLERMVEEDMLAKKKMGERRAMYWVTD